MDNVIRSVRRKLKFIENGQSFALRRSQKTGRLTFENVNLYFISIYLKFF